LETYPLEDFEDNTFGLPAATTLERALWNPTPQDQTE
jgi:hypothetical protein